LPDLLDRHGGLLFFVPEVVVDPYPTAVRTFLPFGIEVVHGVGDEPLGVDVVLLRSSVKELIDVNPR